MSRGVYPSLHDFRSVGLWVGVALVGLTPAAGRGDVLTDALAAAYAGNPSLTAERAVLRQTDENVPQALSNWRPTVEFTAGDGYDREMTRQTCTKEVPCGIAFLGGATSGAQTAADNLVPRSYGVTISQPIFRGGRTVAQTEEAENQVKSERAHLVAVEQSVLLTVVTDYMNVFTAQSTVDLNVKNEEVYKRQLEATRDRFRVGEVTRTDVAQAEAAYAGAIAGRQQAQGNLQVARASYEHDIGTAPPLLTEPTLHPSLPAKRQEAVDLALAQNPNIASAESAKAAAENAVDVVEGQLLPQISVNAGYSRTLETLQSGLRTDTESITGQLTMPLYEGGAIYSAARQAKEVISQQVSLLDDARRSSLQAGASAWEQLESSRATVISLQSQIKANEIALDGVQQEAAVGSRTVLDILNAEQILFQSRVNLVQAKQTEVIAEFTLAAAIGRLTARDLGLPVDFYDPGAHYEAVHDQWLGLEPDPN
jgi:TolC family type I secretion outer membrane protein